MLQIILEIIYVIFTYIRELLLCIWHIIYYIITKWPSSGILGKCKYFFISALLYLLWVNIIVLFVFVSFISVLIFFVQEEFKKSIIVLSEVMLLLCIFYYLGAVTSFTYVNIVILPSLIKHLIESDKPFWDSIFIFLYNIVKSYENRCSILMDHFILEWTTNNTVKNNKLHLLVWYILYILLICLLYYWCTCILFITFSNIHIIITTNITFVYTLEQVFVIIITQISTLYTPGTYSILMFFMYLMFFIF